MYRAGPALTRLVVATATHVGLKRKANLDGFLVTDFFQPLARDPMEGVGMVQGADGVGIAVFTGHLLDFTRTPDMAERSVAAGFKMSSVAGQQMLQGLAATRIPDDPTAVGSRMLDVLGGVDRAVRAAAMDRRFTDIAVSTTFALFRPGKVHIVQAGETRALLIRGGRVIDLSRGDTLWGPAGMPGSAAAMPVQTLALGAPTPTQPFVTGSEVAPSDGVILCSRGLTSVLKDEQIVNTLYSAGDPGVACRQLVDNAVRSRGEHNVTCVVITPAPPG